MLFHHSSFYLRKVIHIFLRGEKCGGKYPGRNVLDPAAVAVVAAALHGAARRRMAKIGTLLRIFFKEHYANRKNERMNECIIISFL